MENGPQMEMRGIAEVGMGEFSESLRGPQEKRVLRRVFVNKAQCCMEMPELRLRADLSPGESQEGL